MAKLTPMQLITKVGIRKIPMTIQIHKFAIIKVFTASVLAKLQLNGIIC